MESDEQEHEGQAKESKPPSPGNVYNSCHQQSDVTNPETYAGGQPGIRVRTRHAGRDERGPWEANNLACLHMNIYFKYLVQYLLSKV